MNLESIILSETHTKKRKKNIVWPHLYVESKTVELAETE